MSDDWRHFFDQLGAISGPIFALIFVGLSVSSHWAASNVRVAAAARSLSEAAAPLLVSLFAEIPGNRWWIGAVAAGAAGLIAITVYQYFYITESDTERPCHERPMTAPVPRGDLLSWRSCSAPSYLLDSSECSAVCVGVCAPVMTTHGPFPLRSGPAFGSSSLLSALRRRLLALV